MEEIKKCRWCKGTPEIYELRDGWWIDCPLDDCDVHPRLQKPFHRKEDAIKAWNRGC